MSRTSRKDVQTFFETVFCPMFGFKVGYSDGEYNLDYYGIYGGFKIVRITGNSGEHDVFGQTRRSPKEMKEFMHFAVSVYEERLRIEARERKS